MEIALGIGIALPYCFMIITIVPTVDAHYMTLHFSLLFFVIYIFPWDEPFLEDEPE